MRVFEDKKVLKKVEIKRTCNMCGREATDEELLCDAIEPFHIQFGYTSKMDGDIWDFDLCPDCIIEISKLFKISPTIKSIFGYKGR